MDLHGGCTNLRATSSESGLLLTLAELHSGHQLFLLERPQTLTGLGLRFPDG